MAVQVKINKDEASLEELQFIFENSNKSFDIHSLDDKGDYFELEVIGFESKQEAKEAILYEVKKVEFIKDRYAYIEKEKGEKIDISHFFNEYPSEFILEIPPIEDKGILKTNAHTIDLSKNNFTSIEAPEAGFILNFISKEEKKDIENIYLKKIYAPNCKDLLIADCPNLKRENITISEEGFIDSFSNGEYYTNRPKEINVYDFTFFSLSDIKSIVAPNAVSIDFGKFPFPNLEKIYAPNCKFISCEITPKLKEENMKLSDDCEIKNIEKKRKLDEQYNNREKGIVKKDEKSEIILDTFFFKDKEIDTLICNNQYLSDLKAPYVKNIFLEGNLSLTKIEAPKAEKIECINNENLEKIDAPNCKELYIEECPELIEENINVAWDCEIKGLERRNQLKR